MVAGDYIYLDVPTLQTMLQQAITARSNILTLAQSYSVAGRQTSKANLETIDKEIREISFAIQFIGGTLPSREVLADMSHGPEHD